MNKGYYVTYYGTTHIIEPNNNISLTGMDLIKLVIPEGVESVRCWNNYLTELVIPNQVKYVHCFNNQLTKLDIPSSVKWIDCRNNNLTELIVPDSVNWIDCNNNNLTELIVPDDCEVKCDSNVKVINKTMYNRSNRLKNLLK